MDKKVWYDKEKNLIFLSHPYDQEYVDLVKSIPGRWYEAEDHFWSVPNQRRIIDKFAQLISKFNLQLDQSLAESVFCDFVLSEDQLNRSPITLPNTRREELLKLLPIDSLVPRNYQLAGLDLMIERTRVFNGDDMGLGKTGQAILTIELTNSFPCLVVCPAGVKYNWMREWHKWYHKRKVTVIDDLVDSFSTDLLIINYDRLDKNLEWLKKIKWKVVIFDEAHYLKNGKSLRSKASRKIVRGVERRIMLSGTAILNAPIELVNPLTTLGVFEKLFGDWFKYIERYCNATKGVYGWDTSGASNTEELNMVLRRSVYLRREKREVLDELPEIQHSILEVDISNKKEYKTAESDLINYLKNKVSIVASNAAVNAEQLVLLSTLRRLTGRGKLESIYEFIDDFLKSSTRKLLVFGIHKEVVQSIAITYECKKIDGSTDSKYRLGIIRDFAENDERLLVGNIQSLGVGTDGLQDACSDMLITEFPDRPGDIDQIVGRLERIGQKNAINIYYSKAKDTIDEILYDSLELKRVVVDGVNKGRVVERNVSVMKSVLQSYLKSI